MADSQASRAEKLIAARKKVTSLSILHFLALYFTMSILVLVEPKKEPPRQRISTNKKMLGALLKDWALRLTFVARRGPYSNMSTCIEIYCSLDHYTLKWDLTTLQNWIHTGLSTRNILTLLKTQNKILIPCCLPCLNSTYWNNLHNFFYHFSVERIPGTEETERKK
jgi:hypothetical protein